MKQNEESREFACWIGLDWADQKHDLCLCPAGTLKYEENILEHKPEMLVQWVAGLRQRFGGKPVAIALEQSRGALIHAFMGHDFLVIFPINPATLDRFRKAFTNSGAKDDPTDAKLLLEILMKHPDKLKAWKPEDVQTRKLGRLVEARRKVVNLRTRLAQMLAAALKESFPQALEWVGGELASVLTCEFLLKWPTLQAVQKVPIEKLRKFYYAHNCRRGDLIEKRLEEIKKGIPLTQDEAVLESSAMFIQTLARQLRAILPSIAEYDRKIAEVFCQHPDEAIFSSLPGAGKVLAPRLLVAFGMDRSRFESAVEIQQYSGIAPVTQRSGKSFQVHRRWACPKFILQSFHEFAGTSLMFCQWAKKYYDQLRIRGKGHHSAVRALAFKWIRIIFRCWKNKKPYDESIYLHALKKNNSPHQLSAI